MPKVIRFMIYDSPVPASRPRVTRWGTYNTPKYEHYKKHVTQTYKDTGLGMVFDKGTPIFVNLIFFRQNQKHISKVERHRRQNLTSVPTIKPDIDNYTKAIYDGLNGEAWHDDSQIIGQSSFKIYADELNKKTRPRVLVEIRECTTELLQNKLRRIL